MTFYINTVDFQREIVNLTFIKMKAQNFDKGCQDGVSPWRKAKPRAPISDYNASPNGKTSPDLG